MGGNVMNREVNNKSVIATGITSFDVSFVLCVYFKVALRV